MRKIDRSKQVDKFLDSLPEKHFNQIDVKIIDLSKNPLPNDSIKLKGTGIIFYRADVGEYRIIYRFNSDIIFIVLVGKRNDGDVYKKFFRKYT